MNAERNNRPQDDGPQGELFGVFKGQNGENPKFVKGMIVFKKTPNGPIRHFVASDPNAVPPYAFPDSLFYVDINDAPEE